MIHSFHVTEIAAIAPHAKLILEKEGWVRIDGFGVFFKTTDPAIENSIKRANRVRDELIKHLKALGLKRKSAFMRIVAEGRGDSSNIEQSNTRRLSVLILMAWLVNYRYLAIITFICRTKALQQLFSVLIRTIAI
jgi:hypothetical protein